MWKIHPTKTPSLGSVNISSGEIVIDGVDVAQVEPKDRDIAMVFQSYALYPNMTVAAQYRFRFEDPAKTPQQDIDAEVNRRSGNAANWTIADRKPSQLFWWSASTCRRPHWLAVLSCIYLMSRFQLGCQLRVEMRHQIKRLHQKLNTTGLFMWTHDQIELWLLRIASQ